MKILVDADACPNAIKQILFRAANKRQITCLLFANHPLTIPKSAFIRFMQVSKGVDVADNEIEAQVEKGDLVITADVPLAKLVIDKQAIAINPRGTLYTPENIKQKLGMRNFLTELRDAGHITGGPKALGKKDLQLFANALDRYLTKQHRP